MNLISLRLKKDFNRWMDPIGCNCKCDCHGGFDNTIYPGDTFIFGMMGEHYTFSNINNGTLPYGIEKALFGDNAIIALFKNGSVKMYNGRVGDLGGMNLCGSCNHEAARRICYGYEHIVKVPKIVSIAAGNGYYLLVDEEGCVWTFGMNNYGQLGQSSKEICIVDPMKIPKVEDAKEVFAGHDHSAILLKNGNVLIFGKNKNSELGMLQINKIITPTPNDVLSNGKRIKKICFGYEHTVALDEDGKIWVAGFNTYGQLGIPEVAKLTEFIQLGAIPERATDIDTGKYHNVVLTEQGNVYVFGRNDYGQLGVGHKNNVTEPCKLNMTMKVIQICTSDTVTLFRCDDGCFYLAGYGGNQFRDVVKPPYLCSREPKKIEFCTERLKGRHGFQIVDLTNKYFIVKVSNW